MSDGNLSKVWNVIADELNLRMNALNDFKPVMVEYYKTTLSNYDCENPRTFKCRSLAQPVSCDCILTIIIYFLIFWARSNRLTLLQNPCHSCFFLSLIT